MAGNGVHRFDVPAEPFRLARVDQHPSLRQVEHLAHRQDGQKSGTGREVTAIRELLHVRAIVPGLHPGRPAPVEHAYVAMAGPAEQPPAPRGRTAAPVVVHHHREVVAHPGCAHRLLEDSNVRQRMASAWAGRSREGAVQVDVRRTGDVPAGELVGAGRTTQPVAHVEDGAVAGRHQGGELVDIDQRMCLHGMILPDG